MQIGTSGSGYNSTAMVVTTRIGGQPHRNDSVGARRPIRFPIVTDASHNACGEKEKQETTSQRPGKSRYDKPRLDVNL